ncbi:MAG TPA: hypothetical protein ENJ09_12160 [Planctomycetes bacterium]|nr:hypothetical protein [Planctomycetota bacterium]
MWAAMTNSTLRLLGLAALVMLGGCGGGEKVHHPNLVLISIDTLRPDFLGAYGHPRPTSPDIDAFAAQGVRFTDVTSASPWTLPSHASMLTGLYPSSHGVEDHDRQLTKETLGTVLKRAGFETLAVVNSHNIGDKRFGLLRGFEKSTYQIETEFDPETKLITNQGPKIAKRAIEYLRARDPERPFFLFLHFYDVHTDFTPDPKWKLEFVGPYSGELNGNTQQLIRYRTKENVLAPEDVVWLEEMYEAEIRTFDGVFRRVLDYLDASGLAEDTVVAVTADHGEEYYEHHGVLHGRTYYQEVIRIPLLLRGPGIPAGLEVDTPVHLVDLTRTLYGLVGVEPPAGLDGIDLSPAWTGGVLPADRTLFAEADHNNRVDGEDVSNIRRMLRVGSEKLIFDTITGRKELYDLASDPAEQHDLASERPERVAELFAILEDFMHREVHPEARELSPMDEDAQAQLNRLGY